MNILPELRVPIDLRRYAGVWYEVARSKEIPFETDTTDVRAIYSWDGRTFHIRNEAMREGRPISWESHVIRIKNAFNTVFAIRAAPRVEGEYRILLLDPDYKWAVVASEHNRWVWVLSREPLLTEQTWIGILGQLESNFGVDLRTLEYTVHTGVPAPSLPEKKPVPPAIYHGDGLFTVSIVRPPQV